jgi:hypothetical protein
MNPTENPPRKPAPRGLKILLTATIGTMVIGLLGIVLGFARNQTSTLAIGVVMLTVSGLLGLFVLNLMFPRRPR